MSNPVSNERVPEVPEAQPHSSWDFVPVQALKLGTRASTCLDAAEIRSVGAVLLMSQSELMALPNFGATTLKDLERGLGELGLVLGGNNAPPGADMPLLGMGEMDAAAIDPAITESNRQFQLALGALREVAAEAFAYEPAATLGDLFADIAAGKAAHLVNAKLADAVAGTRLSSIAGDRVTAYDWHVVILKEASAFAASDESYGERNREIVEMLLPGRHTQRHTLEAVANQFGFLTRERVRQVQEMARIRLRRIPILERAARQLAELLTPMASRQALLNAGFDPEDLATQYLADLAVGMDLIHNRANLQPAALAGIDWFCGLSSLNPALIVQDAMATFHLEIASRAEVVEIVSAELAGHVADPSESDALIEVVITDEERYRLEVDLIIRWDGSYLQKARRVLAVNGDPMKVSEIVAKIDPTKERSILSQLYSEQDHIIRTSDNKYALAEWDDIEPYSSLVDRMHDLIAENGGSMSLLKLRQVIDASTMFSGTSVPMLAGTHLDFIEENGVIRTRREDEQLAIGSPEQNGWMFRVVDGPDRGKWSCSTLVSYPALRGSSLEPPMPTATLLGLAYDEESEITINGSKVRVTFRGQGVRLFSRDVVPLLRSMGANNGDLIELVFDGPGEISLTVKTPLTAHASASDKLRQIIGGEGTDQLLPDLAYAVGLDGTFDEDFFASDLIERLSQRPDRREEKIMALLFSVFPELED